MNHLMTRRLSSFLQMGVIPEDVTKQYLERNFAAKPKPALPLKTADKSIRNVQCCDR